MTEGPFGNDRGKARIVSPLGIRLAKLGASLGARVRARVFALRTWLRRHARELRRTALGLALGTLVGALIWRHAQARLHAINTGDVPLLVLVDGDVIATLPVVSVETPDAIVVLRIAPGPHHILTRHASPDDPEDHEIVDDIEVRLGWSTSYLFAPGFTEQCFWIQHTAYGRARRSLPALHALPRDQRLWGIPDEIDAWFVPNPPPNPLDHRSSGGTRTAIRQGRCGVDPWQ